MIAKIHSFSDQFRSIVSDESNEIMLIDANSGRKFSYSDIDLKIKSCVSLIGEYTKGNNTQCVLSLLPNSIDTLIIFFALALSNNKYAPSHPGSSLLEIESWLSIVRPSLCFLPKDTNNSILLLLEKKSIPFIYVLIDGSFKWLKSSSQSVVYVSNKSKLLLKTSGTTGAPKAMCLNIDTLWSSAVYFVDCNNSIDKRFTYYNILPMSYLGGLFNLGLIPLVNGGSIVIDDTFSAKTYFKFWKTVNEYCIDVVWLVPTIINGLLRLSNNIGRDCNDNELKVCLVGTAPIKLSDKKLFEDTFDIQLFENYGLSETTFISSEQTDSHNYLRNEGSVGEILPYVSLKLSPLKGNNESVEQFEIRVKSSFLFDGYLNIDGSINIPLDDDGYFLTGDVGFMVNNHLTISGRLKDIAKKGGYVVSLREIEVIVELHPDVIEAAAIAIPHEFYGEGISLFIVIYEKARSIKTNDIRDWLNNHISRYKMPDEINIIDVLPKTNSGKIMKRLLR